jgi:hypothetical protein
VASTRDCSRIANMLRKYSKEKIKWFKISKQQQRLNFFDKGKQQRLNE